MLDDEEFQRDSALFNSGAADGIRERAFDPLLPEYERSTGVHETNPNAVYHHVLSMYGSPCKRCGKPLRTPQARLCGSCTTPRT